MSGTEQSTGPGYRRQCPACDGETFHVDTFPADTASVYCADCGNRTMLADMREASVDARWFDGE
jgi:hypothetical protein